jgi:hypothetical protein
MAQSVLIYNYHLTQSAPTGTSEHLTKKKPPRKMETSLRWSRLNY